MYILKLIREIFSPSQVDPMDCEHEMQWVTLARCKKCGTETGSNTLASGTYLAAMMREQDRRDELGALFTAHRQITNEEHNTAEGKLAGYCMVCRTPWPCKYAMVSDLLGLDACRETLRAVRRILRTPEGGSITTHAEQIMVRLNSPGGPKYSAVWNERNRTWSIVDREKGVIVDHAWAEKRI